MDECNCIVNGGNIEGYIENRIKELEDNTSAELFDSFLQSKLCKKCLTNFTERHSKIHSFEDALQRFVIKSGWGVLDDDVIESGFGTIRTARKDYRCNACRKIILQKNKYIDVTIYTTFKAILHYRLHQHCYSGCMK